MKSIRLSLSALVLMVSACGLDTQPALRIGANIWPGYEPMHVARRQGFFNERAIHLIDFSSSRDVMRAYRNGVIDVAALTMDEALTVAAREPGAHKIVLVTDISNGADCILAQANFADLAALKGHRIGLETNALGAFVLLRALQLHDMTIDMVTPTPIALEQHEQSFKSKTIAAIVTFEPRCSRLKLAGAHEVFTSREIPGEIVDVIITRVGLLDTRAAALEQFVHGWFAALDRLQRASPATVELAALHQGIPPDAFQHSLNGLHFVDRAENLRLLGGDAPDLVATLDHLAESMRKDRLLSANVATRTLPDSRIVERAQP